MQQDDSIDDWERARKTRPPLDDGSGDGLNSDALYREFEHELEAYRNSHDAGRTYASRGNDIDSGTPLYDDLDDGKYSNGEYSREPYYDEVEKDLYLHSNGYDPFGDEKRRRDDWSEYEPYDHEDFEDYEGELERFDGLVLKGIALGVRSPHKLARLINLDDEAVRRKMAALIAEDYVNGVTFRLTEKGCNALDGKTISKISAAKLEPRSRIKEPWYVIFVPKFLSGLTHGIAFLLGAAIVGVLIVLFMLMFLGMLL